jgi:hypothetical protein
VASSRQLPGASAYARKTTPPAPASRWPQRWGLLSGGFVRKRISLPLSPQDRDDLFTADGSMSHRHSDQLETVSAGVR